MAKKKNNQRIDEAEEQHPRHQYGKADAVAPPSYGIMDLTPVKRPINTLTETEAQRRELKRRYKAVFGYKPVEQDLVELRRLVEAAEADRVI